MPVARVACRSLDFLTHCTTVLCSHDPVTPPIMHAQQFPCILHFHSHPVLPPAASSPLSSLAEVVGSLLRHMRTRFRLLGTSPEPACPPPPPLRLPPRSPPCSPPLQASSWATTAW